MGNDMDPVKWIILGVVAFVAALSITLFYISASVEQKALPPEQTISE